MGLRHTADRAATQGLSRTTGSGVGSGQGVVVAEPELAEVIAYAVVGAVLFVDLQDATVFGVGGGKNARRLAGQEKTGVGAMAINKAADDEHGGQGSRFSRGCESWWQNDW